MSFCKQTQSWYILAIHRSGKTQSEYMGTITLNHLKLFNCLKSVWQCFCRGRKPESGSMRRWWCQDPGMPFGLPNPAMMNPGEELLFSKLVPIVFLVFVRFSHDDAEYERRSSAELEKLHRIRISSQSKLRRRYECERINTRVYCFSNQSEFFGPVCVQWEIL